MPSYSQVKSVSLSKVISGSALIAGTAIGAGMLAIPLVTAQSGFFPAVATSILVWLFMLSTGLLFMEAALWMPKGSNILSMSSQLLGRSGKYAAGGMFLFLYYCLIVAYFAGGAPLLSGVLSDLFGVSLSGWGSYLVFGGIFGIIVAKGAKAIDRVNLTLTVAMILAYVTLISTGSTEVSSNLLARANWPGFYFALPILFGAFGYHNVIPSVCTYLERDRKSIRLSIICGTTLALT
ncbi:MAG: aromatic amino acid transport family protein, partial [Parachlamydiales bacterium]